MFLEKPFEVLVLLVLLAVAFVAGLLAAPLILLGLVFPPLLVVPLLLLLPIIVAILAWVAWMLLKPTP